MDIKICSKEDCHLSGQPQPLKNFGINRQRPDGRNTTCMKCSVKYNQIRRDFGKKLRSLTGNDRDITISCLYVSGVENIKRLSTLLEISEDFIINILRKENLYEYHECTKCGYLKHHSLFPKRNTADKGIMSRCKLCNSNDTKINNKINSEKLRDRRINRRISSVQYDIYASKISFADPVRRSLENSEILETKCTYCGKWFEPNGQSIDLRVDALNGRLSLLAENRLYCSNNCKKECPIYRKHVETLIKDDLRNSGQFIAKDVNREVQPELRQIVLNRDNYTCTKCNIHQDDLEVGLHCHHIDGIWLNPIESADIDQCITVCKTCHLLIHTKDGCKHHELKCIKRD